MVTETMVLIALKQKNWSRAESLTTEICLNDPESKMKAILSAAKSAPEDQFAAHLLSLWAEIRWSEINDDEVFI